MQTINMDKHVLAVVTRTLVEVGVAEAEAEARAQGKLAEALAVFGSIFNSSSDVPGANSQKSALDVARAATEVLKAWAQKNA